MTLYKIKYRINHMITDTWMEAYSEGEAVAKLMILNPKAYFVGIYTVKQ